MKKIIIAFITLLFCASLFAEDFVVNKVKGTVKYESSKDVWTKLKEGDTVKTETSINVGLSAVLELKAEDGKIFYITGARKGTVEYLLSNASTKPPATQKQTDTLVEVADMPAYIDERCSETFNAFGFSSIKNLPANKNVVRLCSTSWSHEIIELTWTDSSASIIYVNGDTNPWIETDAKGEIIKKDNTTKENKRIQLDVTKQDIQKIVDIIEKNDFYNQPSYTYHTNYSQRDGESWYVEANINGKYKSIDRDMPEKTILKDLGYALYKLVKQK